MKTEYKIRVTDGLYGAGPSRKVKSSKTQEEMYNEALNRAVQASGKKFKEVFAEKIDNLKIQGNTKLTMFKILINGKLMLQMNIES